MSVVIRVVSPALFPERCDAKASGWGSTEMQDSRREEKKSRRKKGRRQGILGSFMKFGTIMI